MTDIFWKIIKKVFFLLEAAAVILLGVFAVLLYSSSMWMFHTWPKLNMDELM